MALCLHYGQTVFEGMKAFRLADGSVSIFRPDKHLLRINRSLERTLFEKSTQEITNDPFEKNNIIANFTKDAEELKTQINKIEV